LLNTQNIRRVLRFVGMGLFPKLSCGWKRVNVENLPPGKFIAGLMQLPMTAPARWYREIVTDFDAIAFGSAKRRWCRSQGFRPHTRHGWEATNRRCFLSRRRFGSASASALLSILPGEGVRTAGGNSHLKSSDKPPGARRRNENGKVERLGPCLRRRSDSSVNTIWRACRHSRCS
jgi:hypothetical protein